MKFHIPLVAFFDQEGRHIEVSGRGESLPAGIETAPGFDVGFIEGVGFRAYLEDDSVDPAFLRVSYPYILPGKLSVSKLREILVSLLFQSVAAVFVVSSYRMLLLQATRSVTDGGVLPS